MYRGQVLSGDVNVSAVSPDGKAGRDSRFRDSGGPVACGGLFIVRESIGMTEAPGFS